MHNYTDKAYIMKSWGLPVLTPFSAHLRPPQICSVLTTSLSVKGEIKYNPDINQRSLLIGLNNNSAYFLEME